MSATNRKRFFYRGSLVLFTGSVMIAMAVACLSGDAQLHEKGTYLSSLKQQLVAVERNNLDLEREIQTLAGFDRIEEAARNELGLVPMTEGDIVYYRGTTMLKTEESDAEEKTGGLFSAFQRWKSSS